MSQTLLMKQCKHCHASLLEQEQRALEEDSLFVEIDIVIGIGVDIDAPGQTCPEGGEADLDRLPVGIDRHIDNIVSVSTLGASRKEDAENLIGAPDHMVIGIGTAGDHIRKSAGSRAERPGNNGMFFAEGDHVFEESEIISVHPQVIPVEPGNFVVLTVAVIVAVLGVAEFIAGEDHGRAAAAHKDSDGIAHHLAAQLLDDGIIRGPFYPAVPAAVVVGAVRVVPAVGLIVLMIVGKQIIEGKTVVTGDEIDRRTESLIFTAVKVIGTHDPGGCLFRVPVVSLEEIPE